MLRNSLLKRVPGEVHKKASKRFHNDIAINTPVLGEDNRNEEEELALEKLVFGGEDDVLAHLKVGDDNRSSSNIDEVKSAWLDEDDQTICADSVGPMGKKLKLKKMYCDHLRDKFENTVGAPKWANINQEKNSSDDDSDDEILQTSGNLLRDSKPLTTNIIDLRKCYDLNKEDRNYRLINSVEFHPSSQVALVAEVSGKAIIFQVDGKNNSKIQSIQFDNFHLSSAHFTKDGEQIIVGSRDHNHFYYYDMMAGKIIKVPWEKGLDPCNKRRLYVSPDGKFIVVCGRFGHIHILSAKTKEWIGQLKMNGEVLSLAFSENGKLMYSHGDNGQIFVWDLHRRQCIHQFYDEGCISGTCLAISPNDQYLAAGSDSGIVNIYENCNFMSKSNPKPVKTFLNLTTEITSLKFNHSSEILAMASNLKDNSIKLAHFPSMTVFSNFPLQNTNMKRITSLDISLNSGYMTLANSKGVANLFRIKKYGNF